MADNVDSEWTFHTLRIYLEALIVEQEKHTMQTLHAADVAVAKAERATEQRLESMNNFRGQLNDMIRTLLPRQEYDVNHKALEDRVDEINKRIEVNSARLDVLTGKAGGLAQGWTILVAVITMALAVYALMK